MRFIEPQQIGTATAAFPLIPVLKGKVGTSIPSPKPTNHTICSSDSAGNDCLSHTVLVLTMDVALLPEDKLVLPFTIEGFVGRPPFNPENSIVELVKVKKTYTTQIIQLFEMSFVHCLCFCFHPTKIIVLGILQN